MSGSFVGHVSTHYTETSREPATFAALEGRLDCDVCVVGGGFAGLVAAIELARGNRSVILLEAGRIASGASGRNAGFVSPGYAESIFAVEERVGKDHARELFRLSMEGVSWVRDAIRRADAADTRDGPIQLGNGYLKVIRHADTLSLERRASRMARDYGHPQEFVSQPSLRRMLVTGGYHAALFDGSAFHLHPMRYAALLTRLAVRLGVLILEDSRARSLRIRNDDWIVRCRKGQIAARHVVLATNAGRGPNGAINRAIVPVTTYMLAARSPSGRLSDAIRFRGSIGDTRRASDYYRLVDSPRGEVLLWGGRITTRGSTPANLARDLVADIRAVYPQLDDLVVDHVWTGTMGYTRHRMPLIGALARGLWVATGFGGHGLNTTAMGGSLVASAILNGDDRWHLFDAFPPRSTWGMLGRAATQFEYWRLATMDRLEEARARRFGSQ